MTATINGDQTGTVGLINSGTAQNTTSGTAIDFTGIPVGVKRITVMLNGVSGSGTSPFLIRVGSGSVATTGYACGVWTANTTSAFNTGGFPLQASIGASTAVFHGTVTIVNVSGNVWTYSSVMGDSGAANNSIGGGSVTLSGALDRLRLTTVNGTDTFDAGSVNVLYE